MISKSRLLQLFLSGMLIVWMQFFGQYEILYAGLMMYLFLQVVTSHNVLLRYLSFYLLVYLGIALLNITDYRNEISIETIEKYILAVLALTLPLVIFSGRRTNSIGDGYEPTSFTNVMIIGHLAISWLAVFYIYSTKGLVIVHQDLRFGIPTSISYVIKSCQYIPFYYLLCSDRSKYSIPISRVTVLAVLPTLLIASRATAILVLLAMLIFYVFDRHYYSLRYPNSSSSRLVYMFAGVGVLSLLFIAGGFYLRREFSDDLLTGPELVEQFFYGNHSWYVYLLVPFHQGFNETAALTSRIVDFGITNSFTNTPLLFADFDNLLGRSSVAAAQYFGDDIGRVGDGGLTPGLVGGVLLDFEDSFFYCFLVAGVLFKVLDFFSSFNRLVLPFLVLYFVQFLHLFHRGFMKPEYFTIILIAAIYIFSMRRVQDSVNESWR